MSDFTILKRRNGSTFHYSLSYLDSANVAILEIDEGDPNNPHARREPTRRLCVANVSHIDELQERCDKWNSANEDRQSEWPSNVFCDFDE